MLTSPTFGLSEKQYTALIQILTTEKVLGYVKIFGSRARGDQKESSDLDLAFTRLSPEVESRLADAFYYSTLPSVDIVDLSRLKNEQLREKIFSEGRSLPL
jgi:uncharacterized protein